MLPWAELFQEHLAQEMTITDKIQAGRQQARRAFNGGFSAIAQSAVTPARQRRRGDCGRADSRRESQEPGQQAGDCGQGTALGNPGNWAGGLTVTAAGGADGCQGGRLARDGQVLVQIGAQSRVFSGRVGKVKRGWKERGTAALRSRRVVD